MPDTQHPPRETPVSGHDYLAVQASPEFQALRKKFRGFVFPMTAFFLVWYFLYVLLSMFAHGLHGHQGGRTRHHGRPALRPRPVRDDVRDHLHLRPLGQP